MNCRWILYPLSHQGSSCQLGPNKIFFLEGRPLLKKKKNSWVYFKWFISPSLPGNTRELFSILYTQNQWASWRWNSGKYSQPYGCPLRLFLKLVHIESPAVSHSCSFSYLFPASCWLQHWFLLLVAYGPLCLPVQFSGQLFLLWPQFTDGPKKNCLFSVCSAFFLNVGMKVIFSSFLHVRLGTKSSYKFWRCIFPLSLLRSNWQITSH